MGFFKLAKKTPFLRDFMNIMRLPFNFSVIFQIKTQIRLQYVEEQGVSAIILSSSLLFMDTHFFGFGRSAWTSKYRISIEGLRQEIGPP